MYLCMDVRGIERIFHVYITSYEQEMANLFFYFQIKERNVTLCICMGSYPLKSNAHFLPNCPDKLKFFFFFHHVKFFWTNFPSVDLRSPEHLKWLTDWSDRSARGVLWRREGPTNWTPMAIEGRPCSDGQHTGPVPTVQRNLRLYR